jgi:putative molybdopterin biosynthesis protein
VSPAASRQEGSGRHRPPAPDRAGARLRLARLAHGLSQQDLARAAGVSRQAIAGFESGQWDPSLRVALALAEALAATVEDLFGPGPGAPALDAVALGPLAHPACRVEVGQVGDRTVALPLSGDLALRAGFVPATGTAAALGSSEQGEMPGPCQVHPSAPLRPSLVVAGCDPALPLLRGPLSRLDQPVELLWWPCGSGEARRLAAAGLVHVAGVHVEAPPRDGRVREAVDRHGAERTEDLDAEVIHFASWREGLALRAGVGDVRSIDDVARRRLRLVNREPGAEARHLLDRHLQATGVDPAEITGYDTATGGHLLVAAALAAGVADAGVTTEPAALAYGLPFVPLAEERSLLAIPRRLLGTPEVQALLGVLATPAVQRQLAGLAGYQDVDSCGVPARA